jgi:tetratricopeptide (TPR) repeat protein
MYRLFSLACFTVGAALAVPSVPAQSAAPALQAEAPASSNARKTFFKAAKELEEHKYAPALEDFRKADSQDGGRCVPCELQAFKVAKQLQDYTAARAETALLLDHVASAEDKAEVHYLAGDVCLSDGGYRIFEKAFQDADSEFQAALQLQPGKPDCVYEDGIALAHLHKYDQARERFEQYMKAASPTELQYKRAKLFAAQRSWRASGSRPIFTSWDWTARRFRWKNLPARWC